MSWFIKYLDYLVALAVYGPLSTSDLMALFGTSNLHVWDFRRAYEGLKIVAPMKVQYSHEKAHRLNPHYPAARELRAFLLDVAKSYPPPPIRKNRSTIIAGWPKSPVCRLRDLNYDMFMSPAMARVLALLSFAKRGSNQRQLATLTDSDEASLVRAMYRLRYWKFINVKRVGINNHVSLNMAHPLLPSLRVLMRRIDAGERTYRHLAKSIVVPKPPKKPTVKKKYTSRLTKRSRSFLK